MSFTASAGGAVADAHRSRYASYLLADELRQSSDDLTRLARTYVVSQDPVWEEQYLEVLAIRNGDQPRPLEYEKIYWDFRAAGITPPRGTAETISLQELMQSAGFTSEEFAKLKEAQGRSDGLVNAETVAMQMVKGRYKDADGNFSIQKEPDLAQARLMLHDETYHASKASIMEPVDEFLSIVDQRTRAAVATAEAQQASWTGVLVVAVTLLLALSVTSLWWIARTVRTRLGKVEALVGRVADGDLGGDTTGEGTDEVGRLIVATNRMSAKLRAIIESVRENASSAVATSGTVSRGSFELTSRTEQQAAALQETSSTMTEMGATVSSNAENAAEAKEIAARAHGVAQEGCSIVGGVVQTMNSIQESSQRISEIVNMIDVVAFQTNLLALNAAVEAARAGEHGKGFSVVAEEVRGLARRSADAAQQVKELIGASVERVDAGAQQVGKASSVMTDIAEHIGRVSERIEHISQASSEQSIGISEVGKAMLQLGQMTQDNAAMAEETTSAASEMKDSASELAKGIAVFQVS